MVKLKSTMGLGKAVVEMNETASKALFEEDVGKISERLLVSRNWILYNKEFPVLDVGFRSDGRAEFRVRLIATNWNDEPSSVELLDANGKFLSAQQIPEDCGNVFNRSNHQTTGRPFVCMAGSREYHTHPSHLNDSWNNYKCKDGFKLGGIMTQLWSAWQKEKS